MNTRPLLALAASAAFLTGCSTAPYVSGPRTADDATVNVLPASEVPWTALNPARGDKSPQAGTIWGDRKGKVPTGFLVKFVDGFSSPPHIHNVTYRGVVIHGLVHNDDPDAANMWMPPGSYWTQPAGEVHITSATGQTNVAFIEIAKGPYLVMPPAEAFDNGERPVNVDPSNFVWLDASNTPWISDEGPELVHLWGTPANGELNASMLKLPPGFTGYLQTNGAPLNAVVIQGEPTHEVPGKADAQALAPGSSFDSQGVTAHAFTNNSHEAATLYVRIEGKYTVTGEIGPVTAAKTEVAEPALTTTNQAAPAQNRVFLEGDLHESCPVCFVKPEAPTILSSMRDDE
ncbi:DUF4437 domain-containing protein [Algisphaera agarilytica]|uniref:DUF4437 domain-containing protein n=1 Tax=Algisphaera agarilytica TaxID=1385975 RepID=A0A7X0LLU4_9BACT|nr:DUF4437 domain-containing protein [Algisphaera agarilytica]MBB6431279.1 hypothetical protein [Algisphaera agarilytica]